MATQDFSAETFTAEGQDYDIGNYQYPEDLGNTEWDLRTGASRVMFFINVQGGGKIVRENLMDVQSGTPTSRHKKTPGDKVKENAQAAAAVQRAATAAKSVSVDVSNAILRLAAPKKRLVAAISLYMPEALTKSYSVDWGVESNDAMMKGELYAQTLLGGLDIAENHNKADGGARGAHQIMDAVVGYKAATLLNNMKYTQKALGVTPGNSKAELLFNAVDFNSFSFDYKFAPRSESEAANVLQIIRTFRHHMLPEYFDELNFLYIYPSEFEVRYYKGDDENKYLEQNITAVLKSMTINYNPNGQFMTFNNGMPTHINMTLTFQELGVPTKETSPHNESGA